MSTAILHRRQPLDLPRRASRVWAAYELALSHNAVWTCGVAVVVALQALLIVTHVPWLDEVQALLIAWQSPDLSSLLQSLRYEGHPPLWYLILRGLTDAVPLAWVLPAASLAIALAIQSLIVWKAPFGRGEQLLLLLSAFLLIEVNTISRSLALGALMMVAAAAFWRGRVAWLPIAILPMCDFLFGVLSLLLIATRHRERLLWLPGLSAWAATGMLAAWSVIPAPGVVAAESHMTPMMEITDFLQRLGGLVLPFQTFLGGLAWDGYPPMGTGGLLAGILSIWLWKWTRTDRFRRVIVFGYIAFCFAFSIAVYPLHLRHLSTIALLFIFLMWIAPPAERGQAWWRVWLSSCAVCGVLTAGILLSRPFDAAPHAAKVMANLDDGRPWLSWPANRTPPLYFNSGIRMIQPEQGCSHSFVRWNHRSSIRNGQDLYRAMPNWAARYGQSYLVLERLPQGVPETLYRPLTRLRGYNGQRYIIGILGPNEPLKPRAYPPCVEGSRDLR